MRSQQTVAARDADFVDDDFSKRLLKLTEAKDCSEASGWQAAFTKEAHEVIANGILGLLEICFWREGLEGAFGPERSGGGCGGKRGGVGGLAWRWAVFRQEKSLIHAIFYWNRETLAE